MKVPSAVPSVFQSSVPCSASVAMKYREPLNSAKEPGYEFAVQGFRSFSILVPSAVPSEIQSSVPYSASPALKYSEPLNSVKESGVEDAAQGLRSFTKRRTGSRVSASPPPSLPFTGEVSPSTKAPVQTGAFMSQATTLSDVGSGKVPTTNALSSVGRIHATWKKESDLERHDAAFEGTSRAPTERDESSDSAKTLGRSCGCGKKKDSNFSWLSLSFDQFGFPAE